MKKDTPFQYTKNADARFCKESLRKRTYTCICVQNYVVLAQLTVIAKLRFARTDKLRLSKSFACVKQSMQSFTLQNYVLQSALQCVQNVVLQ